MNLTNINLETIFENVKLIDKEIYRDSMTLNDVKFFGLIQTASLVFGSNFNVKIGEKITCNTFIEYIIKARKEFDSIKLIIDSGEITFGFDEESEHWIVMTTTTPNYKGIILNLLSLRKIAVKEKFEINLGSYKVMQVAIELRKP